ncbi:unnamed protein product, partial [marine sediment metagenome]
TVLTSAMITAAQHHATQGRGGLTRISAEGVKTQKVDRWTEFPKEARTRLAQDIHTDGDKHLWFAQEKEGRMHIFTVDTATCTAALEVATASADGNEEEETLKIEEIED